jgi:hypothetical protein
MLKVAAASFDLFAVGLGSQLKLWYVDSSTASPAVADRIRNGDNVYLLHPTRRNYNSSEG